MNRQELVSMVESSGLGISIEEDNDEQILLYTGLYPKKDNVCTFKLHWLFGKKEIVKGNSISDAFTHAGLGAGAAKALDYYEEILGDLYDRPAEDDQAQKMMTREEFNQKYSSFIDEFQMEEDNEGQIMFYTNL